MKKIRVIVLLILLAISFGSCVSSKGMAGGGCNMNTRLVGYR